MSVVGRFLLGALLWSHDCAAQDLRFQHLTTDNGLSDNAVTCLFQDRAGYIWIGTESGLDRFDGQRVLPVAEVRENVTAVLEDRDGIVWATTRRNGLRKLSGDGVLIASFTKADGETAIASDQLTALFDLNDTTLLIGSSEVSMIFMDKRTHRFTYWTDSASIDPAHASARPGPQGGWCHGFTVLSDGTVWISMLNHRRSFVADPRTGVIVQSVLHTRPGIETIVAATEIDGRVFASGWQTGIDVLEKPGGSGPWTHVDVLPLEDEGLALAAWNDGRIIAGTRGIGLRVIDTRTGWSIACRLDRNDASSLPGDQVRALLVDRSGTIWVGTTNGLAFHAPSVWAMREHALAHAGDGPQELVFHRLSEDTDGSLRAFTSNGFFVLDTAGRVEHASIFHDGVELQPTVIGVDGAGGMLLGTEYGMLRWDPSTQQPLGAFTPYFEGHQHFAPGSMFQVRGLISDTIDRQPVLHIATLGYHVMTVEARTGRILGYAAPHGAARSNLFSLVHDAVRDRTGRCWQATSGGICFWDRGMPLVHNWADADAQRNDGILLEGVDARQLRQSGDTLWALLTEGALVRIIGGRPEHFAPPTHLARRMLGFANDTQGRFWITTTNGLLRFDPEDGSWLGVPVNDGRRFRKLSKAITALHDGRIAFCADNSIITFDPRAFDALPALPALRITSTSAGEKPIRVNDGSAVLPYSSPLIDIGVSALAHGLPQPLTFLYRLEGVEEEWRTLPMGEAIRYVGVPVGGHRLLVKSRDAYGRESAEQTLLTIVVRAPFWLTWWFYALIALVVSVGVYAWSRYRIAQAMKLHAVRDRIASDLHDEVGSSLSSITIGTQLARQMSTTQNEQVNALLARIGETSSSSLRSISDIVWAIDPKNDEGEALVKRMRRIAGELLESKGVEVSFEVSGGVEELRLPMNARKEIVLLYKEAVHNASKYSGAQLVQVSLHRRNGSLAVSVKDDGCGFDPALHPDGHGLGSMKRRAKQLGTELTLRSAPGLGTLVGVEVDLTRIRD